MATSANTAPKQGASSKFKIAAAVLGVLTVAGVAAWIYQLVGGLSVTGMSNGTS